MYIPVHNIILIESGSLCLGDLVPKDLDDM